MATCMGVAGGWRCFTLPKRSLHRCLVNPVLQKCRNDCYSGVHTKAFPSNRLHGALYQNIAAEFSSPCQSLLSKVRPTSQLSVRAFNSSRRENEKDTYHRKDFNDKEDHGLLVRFNNENGYLSWCRNAYLATTAGAVITSQEAAIANAREVGTLIIFLGGLNLLNGTFSFLYFLVQLRRQGRISLSASLIQVTLAMLHVLLWLAAMAIYIGVVEEDPQVIETDIIEVFSDNPSSKR